MRRLGSRAGERTGRLPGRARVLLAVAASTVAVAGVAVVVQRSDGGTEGRWRRGHYSGAIETPSTAPEPSGDRPADAGSPAGPVEESPGSVPRDGAVPTTGSGPAGPGTPGSTGPVPGPADGGAGVVEDSGGTSGPGQPPPTQRPAAPAPTAPDGDSEASGWHSLPKAPIGGRTYHSAVWTGREMMIWGGVSDSGADPSTDGAAFDPAARTWRKVPAAPLSPRYDARAVWTGREVIVFGGGSEVGEALGDGAAWDPAAGTWRSLPPSPLGPRDGAVVAWAGDRLVVWGGSPAAASDASPEAEAEMRNDGAAYLPATDTWVRLAAAPVPGRGGAEAAWTGSRLVISGGYLVGDDDDRTDGAALDPVSGTWSTIAARPEPGSCAGAACVGAWTGREVLFPTSGLRYDPAGDRWSAVAPGPDGGPAPGEPAVWDGRRLLVWGIAGGGGSDDGAGDAGEDDGIPTAAAAYDPDADRWEALPGGPLDGREGHTVIWTGEEMLVWGGGAGDVSFADGAAYRRP